MIKTAVVISNENKIFVRVLDSNIKRNYKQQKLSVEDSESIEARNPRNFSVSAGSVVAIRTSKTVEVLYGIISLLIPVFSAAAGFCFSSFVLKNQSELLKAFFVLLFLAIPSAVIFVLSRFIRIDSRPKIIAMRGES